MGKNQGTPTGFLVSRWLSTICSVSCPDQQRWSFYLRISGLNQEPEQLQGYYREEGGRGEGRFSLSCFSVVSPLCSGCLKATLGLYTVFLAWPGDAGEQPSVPEVCPLVLFRSSLVNKSNSHTVQYISCRPELRLHLCFWPVLAGFYRVGSGHWVTHMHFSVGFAECGLWRNGLSS